MKKILLSLFVFILLFSPPILPGIRLMYILALFSGLMIVTKYRHEAIEVMKSSRLGLIMKFFLGLSGYIALVTILSGGSVGLYFIDSIGKLLLTGPALGLCVTYLILVFKDEKYDINQILKIIMYAGLLQAILSALAFLVPSLKVFLISIMQHNVGTAALYDPFQIETRLFGFAGDMFDRFGYGMGMLSVVPVLLAYNTGRMRYIAVAPLFIVSAILNSRTSILMLIVMVLPMTLLVFRKYAFNTRRGKTMLRSLLIIILTIVGGVYAINGVFDNGNDNIKGYTVSNYQSVFDYFTGESSAVTERDNTAERLFSGRSWQLPDNVTELIFGTGHSKYEIKGLSHSDVGYTNDIWMFGVMGAIFTYSVLVFFTLKIYKRGVQYRLLAIGLLACFFIYQVKGVALWSANFGIAVHVMLVAIIAWYYQHLENTNTVKGVV